MNAIESLLFWLSALCLAGSLLGAIVALVYGRAGALRASRWLALAALGALSVLGGARWIRSGHPPFVTLFESMLAGIWFLLLILAVLQRRGLGGAAILAPASGSALLLMGWSASLPKEASPLSAALDNVWLFIHASFATVGAATFLIGASFALAYLLGENRLSKLRLAAERLPEHRALPRSVERALLLGLVLWGVMIASGSVWAHNAWGRYWAWDPIEIWSLISWLLYGAIFHARLALKLSARTFAWLAILAVFTVLFALWGVHYAYETIHTYG